MDQGGTQVTSEVFLTCEDDGSAPRLGTFVALVRVERLFFLGSAFMFQNIHKCAALRAVIRLVPALTSVETSSEDCPDAVALWLFNGSFNWGWCRATSLMVTPGAWLPGPATAALRA